MMFACWNRHLRYNRSLADSVLVLSTVLLAGCGLGGDSNGGTSTTNVFASGTPGAEADVGERLFVETRFAQFFKSYLDSGGDVNDVLPAGDPVLAKKETSGSGVSLPGPFAGLSMNCRACHLVDEHVGPPGGRDTNLYGLRSAKSASGPQ